MIVLFNESVTLVLLSLLPFRDHGSTLLPEALSLIAFGIAWLIKGRVPGDTGKTGDQLYGERNYPS